MKVFMLAIAMLAVTRFNGQQVPTAGTDTSAINLHEFATGIVAGVNDNYGKAKKLLEWLGQHFEWKGTDYVSRTPKQVIARGGGNCFELATVYMSLLKELNIVYRPIAEINIHKYSEQRGINAAERIRRTGNQASVFGKQHNDHRWVEIYDDSTKDWIPADPTMNLIGFDDWLKARAWFGPRHTINDQFSSDMIVPFGIYVASPEKKIDMKEDRTTLYLVRKLDELYDGKLSRLPSWNRWVSGLQELSPLGMKAFRGELNLHDYSKQIAALAETYQRLKDEYESAKKDASGKSSQQP